MKTSPRGTRLDRRRQAMAATAAKERGRSARRSSRKPILLAFASLAIVLVLLLAGLSGAPGSTKPGSSATRPSGLAALPLIGAILGERLIDVEGVVVDAESDQPLPGARLEVEGKPTASDAAGRFWLEAIRKDAAINFSAAGYRPATASPGREPQLRVALPPLVFEGSVADAYRGQAIPGARVTAEGRRVSGDAAGRFRFTAVPEGTALAVSADGYAPAEVVAKLGVPLTVSLRPNVVSGRITQAGNGKPVEGARVTAGDASTSSDADGNYRLAGVPAVGTLLASAPGYDKAEAALSRSVTQDFQLSPRTIRAAYLTLSGAGYKPMRDKVLGLIATTELNAVVIDVKDDDGSLAYESAVPLAKAVGALKRTTIPDPAALVADLKKRGIYTIARIITFKDDLLSENGAKAGADVGIKDSRTGRPWKDQSQGLGWVDPSRTQAWDYNIAIAKEAARIGFDEIQFDYIRFPADPNLRYAVFSKENNSENRLAAVNGFLRRARDELKPLGVYLAVDVFGYASWQQDDPNLPLGQNIEDMAKYVDFIAPMNYPSLFWFGLPTTPSYQPAEDYPYEILKLSVENAARRIAGTGARIRSWIQYYDGDNRRYTAADIVAQKKGAIDGGSLGWMLWEPFVRYDKGGLVAR